MSMRSARSQYLLWALFLLAVVPSLAQESSPILVPSAVPTLVIDIPNTDQLLAEDKRLGLDARFASPITTELTTNNSGAWEIANDEHNWQLNIRVPGAKGIYLALDQLQLPTNAWLSVWSLDGELVDQYSGEHSPAKNKVLLYGGAGEELQIKYKVSSSLAQNHDDFRIFKIFHVYRSGEDKMEVNSPTDFLDCHLNSVCLEDPILAQKSKGGVRILRYFEEGLAWCSGALINNTRQDQKPYLLTAYHCIDGLQPDYDLWRFDFNLASPDCEGEIDPQLRQQLCGAEFRAGRRESDFLLLELKDKIPAAFRPHFMGWNRSDQIPIKTIAVHHPQGAWQKMAIDQDAPQLQSSPILWSNQVSTPAGFHWVVQFDQGTQETGSSGGPLLNEKGQIIGQLHGGNANCQSSKSYFGRLSKSWDLGDARSERLDGWLDPIQSGKQECPAYSPEADRFCLSGKVLNQYGGHMINIEMKLTGAGPETLVCTTDQNGNYVFTDLPANQDYSLRPLVSNQQAGEIIIKIKEGKRKATFSAQKAALKSPPISQQAVNSTSFLFDRIYPNQIDVEQMQHSLQRLDFTIIRN